MKSAQQLAKIDRKIDAIRKQLCGLEKIDPMSSESWQAAWDKHPDLLKAEKALFRKRAEMQAAL